MKKGTHLIQLKLEELHRNRDKLSQALDRFQSGQLKHLKKGSKLTILNFSIEAKLSKSTAFSKYREGHKLSGEHRFPEIVSRFNKLRKEMLAPVKKKQNDREKMKQLKLDLYEIKERLFISRNLVNAQDIRIADIEKKLQKLESNEVQYIKQIKELKEENAGLKRRDISIINHAKRE